MLIPRRATLTSCHPLVYNLHYRFATLLCHSEFVVVVPLPVLAWLCWSVRCFDVSSSMGSEVSGQDAELLEIRKGIWIVDGFASLDIHHAGAC